MKYRGTDETTSWLLKSGSISLSLASLLVHRPVERRKNHLKIISEFSSYLSTLHLGIAVCTVLGRPVLETPRTQQKATKSLYPYWKVSEAIWLCRLKPSHQRREPMFWLNAVSTASYWWFTTCNSVSWLAEITCRYRVRLGTDAQVIESITATEGIAKFDSR